MDDVVLEDKGESEDGDETNDVEGAFGDDGPHQLVGRNFFVTGKDGAFDHFAETGGAEVDEIADHHPEKAVDARGLIAHGLDELAPAEGPKPMAGQQQGEDGYQQPVVGAVEGVFELRPFAGIHVLET